MRVSTGRDVHYVSYGTPGGEYLSECRAAKVTQVHQDTVDLIVFNPTGLFFNMDVRQDELKSAGSWHWPERVD